MALELCELTVELGAKLLILHALLGFVGVVRRHLADGTGVAYDPLPMGRRGGCVFAPSPKSYLYMTLYMCCLWLIGNVKAGKNRYRSRKRYLKMSPSRMKQCM